MNKNNNDTFEGVKHSISPSENFFLNEGLFSANNTYITEPARRLNDYDSNLLEEDAYKDVNDELFKLEYKIYKLEDQIKTLYSQIQAAKDIGDYELAESLFNQVNNSEKEHERLTEIYNNKSISANISNKILFSIKNKFKKFQPNLQKISNKISKKIPKSILAIIELKESLTKLENLNKSVDELITMNIPYGESSNKYEQLSKYIIKANSIQANISNQIKNK